MDALTQFKRFNKVLNMSQPSKSELPFAPVVQPPKLRFRVETTSRFKDIPAQVSIRSTQKAAMTCAHYDKTKLNVKSVQVFDTAKSETVPIWEWRKPSVG